MTVEVTNQTKLLHGLGDACMTIDVLSQELGMSRRQITNAAMSLIQKGLVERAALGCFQRTAEGHEAAARGDVITSGPNGPLAKDRKPLPNTLRQRAWNVIRIQRKFTIPDLLVAATSGEEKLATNNLQRYCKALSVAGVIRRLPGVRPGTSPSSPGFARYMLVQDLGPIAPTYRQSGKAIFDHNSSEEMAL